MLSCPSRNFSLKNPRSCVRSASRRDFAAVSEGEMAKWGEGDPRWIVEERPDATNVNNWHWTEKNATSWSLDKIKELLKGLSFEGEGHKCSIYEVDQCKGEAFVNNRKGKLIFFYEWDITLKWKAVLLGQEDVESKESDDKSTSKKKNFTKGTIHIPNLSEENSVEEVDVLVSMKECGMDHEKVQRLVNTEGAKVVREQLSKYLMLLKEEFSKGVLLPKKGEEDPSAQLKTVKDSSKDVKQAMLNGRPVSSAKASESKIGALDTTNINMRQSFQCTAEDFFRALTQIELVQAFTNGPVKLEPHQGGRFELFGGNVYGEFIEVTPNTRIVQSWRMKSWPSNHYSTVVEYESTKNGWDIYYWSAMKRTLCFGAFVV
ncbi:hypothetical protein J437_LFUL015035 [Ladona fulva]|uniref:Activator of Hsp90 ATPase AHSA1-like N-terminal domain-containing protein n=1 Tax=Ladona fulva TaxID=123851 RepID=A0A8K0KHC0_LADFU|nr:hypothetical protein J437_LFUL015035 [Ladona fulva]